MDKNESYSRWDACHKITCRTAEMCPPEPVDRVFISGLRSAPAGLPA